MKARKNNKLVEKANNEYHKPKWMKKKAALFAQMEDLLTRSLEKADYSETLRQAAERASEEGNTIDHLLKMSEQAHSTAERLRERAEKIEEKWAMIKPEEPQIPKVASIQEVPRDLEEKPRTLDMSGEEVVRNKLKEGDELGKQMGFGVMLPQLKSQRVPLEFFPKRNLKPRLLPSMTLAKTSFLQQFPAPDEDLKSSLPGTRGVLKFSSSQGSNGSGSVSGSKNENSPAVKILKVAKTGWAGEALPRALEEEIVWPN